MAALYFVGAGVAIVCVLIWALVRSARNEGAADARADQQENAIDAQRDMLEADQPRDRDDTADRLRDGRF